MPFDPVMTPNPTPAPTPGHDHVADDKGYCTVEGCDEIANGKNALAGRSLILNDTIGVTFYMEFTQNIDKNDVVMKFSYNGKTKNVSFAEAIVKNDTAAGKIYYGFKCDVYATEMNETITATLFEGDTELSTYTYSVKEYCDNKLEDEAVQADSATLNLINSMVSYGAMSQNYFAPDAEPMVASTPIPLTEGEIATLNANYLKKDYVEAAPEEIDVIGMTLVLYAQTALRAGFDFGGEYNNDNFTDHFTFKAYDITTGVPQEVTGRTGVYKGEAYFEIININPAMLSNTFKIVVLKGEEQMVEIEYSPFTYINSMRQKGTTTPELQNVLVALYRYNEAAKAYVNK